MTRLYEILKKNGMTHEELAERTGVERSYITRIAAGKRTPSPKVAAAIERALNGTVTRLQLLYPDEAA